jgi:hypothetical protein
VLPLDIMRARMRNAPLNGQSVTDEQFAAAVAAAPYIHPRLAAVAVATTNDSARCHRSMSRHCRSISAGCFVAF